MIRTRNVVHAVLVLAVALSIAAFFIPTEAKANCFAEYEIHISYKGYQWDTNDFRCYWPSIGPVPPKVVVGQEHWECDGSYSSWGIVCEDYSQVVKRCPLCGPEQP